MKKTSNFKYFVSEGFKSYSQNKLMTLSSTIIVVACLIVFGLYLLFSLNINHIAEQLKSECEIRVWISEEVKPDGAEMKGIKNKIEKLSNVADADFYSNDDALEEYKQELGKNASVLDGLGDDNPLRDSFKIKLIDLSLSEQTAEEIRNIDGVADVNDNQASANKLIQATKVIKNISFWFMLFLSTLAIFIISNTIKITLFARRRDINIMKYLGATNGFISWPYIVEGVVIGFVGALLSFVIMTVSYKYFVSMDITLFEAMDLQFCKLSSVVLPLAAWFVGIGVLLGAIGSAVSIRRHLKV